LPGDGADDAGGGAGEEEREREDGAGSFGDARHEEIVDAEEISVGSCGVVVEGGAGNDEDGGVDEEREGEEAEGEFGVGVFEAEVDGGEGGVVGFFRVELEVFFDEVVLFVVGEKTGLDDAAAEVETVGHDGCS